MFDYAGAVYTENETELSWLIRPGVAYDDNQTEQWCDQAYTYGPC